MRANSWTKESGLAVVDASVLAVDSVSVAGTLACSGGVVVTVFLFEDEGAGTRAWKVLHA